LVGLWFARRRIGRGPLAAALIFGGVLTPVLGFLNVYPFRFSFVADHFQYHASLGLIALFGAGLALAARRFSAPLEKSLPVSKTEAPVSRRTREVATRVVAGAGLVVLAIISFRQTLIYYDVHTLYADVIRKNPEAWMAYSNLGAQLVRDDQVEEALDMFRETLRINPNHYRVHTLYAGALFNLGVRKGFAAGQLEESIEHFEEALRLKPTWTEAREGLAQVFFREGRFDEAQAQLNLVLEHQPLSPMGLLVMGSLMVEAKKWPEAQTYFERAVQMKPDLVEGHQGIGLALVNQGKHREAISHLESVIQIDPESYEAHYTLGNALLNLKDIHAAVDQYLIAIRIKPDNLDALSNLGVAYGIMGNADGAIDCFERILRIDPDFQGAASNLQRAQSLKQNQSSQSPDAK
jgi:tetratricopeptide (TPR) repeat protein